MAVQACCCWPAYSFIHSLLLSAGLYTAVNGCRPLTLTQSLYFNDWGKCLFLWSIMATSNWPSTPTAMDVVVNTPVGSVADGETPYTWNVRDLQTIQDYKKYHYDMWEFFLLVLKEMGPAWQSQENHKLTISLFCVETKRSRKSSLAGSFTTTW